MYVIRILSNRFDQLTTMDVIRIQTHSDERVLPYAFVGGTRMLLIQASAGSGKTHQVREYLSSHPDLARVLVVTASEQQAEATRIALSDLQWDDGSSGFHSSVGCSKRPMDYPTCRLGRFDKLVIHYTALYQMIVGVGITVYDLVVIDDICSVLSETGACANMSRELQLDRDILRTMAASRSSICLDAHLGEDVAVWEWVAGTVSEGRMEFHRYTHPGESRTTVITTHAQWEQQIRASLACGHRVGVICRSKTTMHAVLGLDGVAQHTVLEFDADSNLEQIRQLRDIDQHLRGVDLLAFSGKIAISVNIQEPFHTVYVHGVGGTGPTPSELLRVIGGFRHVTSGRIVCVLPAIVNTR